MTDKIEDRYSILHAFLFPPTPDDDAWSPDISDAKLINKINRLVEFPGSDKIPQHHEVIVLMDRKTPLSVFGYSRHIGRDGTHTVTGIGTANDIKRVRAFVTAFNRSPAEELFAHFLQIHPKIKEGFSSTKMFEGKVAKKFWKRARSLYADATPHDGIDPFEKPIDDFWDHPDNMLRPPKRKDGVDHRDKTIDGFSPIYDSNSTLVLWVPKKKALELEPRIRKVIPRRS